jgi:hypothetical protein
MSAISLPSRSADNRALAPLLIPVSASTCTIMLGTKNAHTHLRHASLAFADEKLGSHTRAHIRAKPLDRSSICLCTLRSKSVGGAVPVSTLAPRNSHTLRRLWSSLRACAGSNKAALRACITIPTAGRGRVISPTSRCLTKLAVCFGAEHFSANSWIIFVL